MRAFRWWWVPAFALPVLPWAGLALAACFVALPAGLEQSHARVTLRVLDREGRLLRELGAGRGARENPLDLREVSGWVVPALLAAEDSRFHEHVGVDPLAVARALGQLVSQRRLVSGASTLTQQLARTLEPRPRTWRGKLHEMALALRIEASLSKREILEEYLSRVEFGPNLIGIQAASQRYFGKAAAALDLAEAAALVSMPRGPSLYDPRRRPHLLERRRLRVLARMAALGQVSPSELARAELTPLTLSAPPTARGAEHLSLALAQRYAAEPGKRTRSVRTTLNADLQNEAERIAQAALPALADHAGTAISLLVLDNETGDVLAYVGSPGYFDAAKQGANDGVLARRQPGSTLKPFVYAAALQELGYGPATLLPDLPQDYLVRGAIFTPRDYDQRFRGPVLLRQALASSLNLPALAVASRLGPARLLAALKRFGFTSLDRDAAHYGVGLALGDGEVTLLELCSAYSALATGGELQAPRLALARSERGGGEVLLAAEPVRRVLTPELAALLTDMLSDDAARAAGFGRDSPLNLPFPVAAKTGTSKGYRDNWAVGYTREVTVGVWVGNFDGSPLRDASGITVAGPAFHDLMLAAMRGKTPAPLVDRSLLVGAEVCAQSGKLPTRVCQHRRLELFVRGHEPHDLCDLHVSARVDQEGREVAEGCGGSPKVLERYPAEFRSWAEQAGRPLLGRLVSPTCPPPAAGSIRPRVTFPRDAQTFALDADGPVRQEIVLTAVSLAQTVRFIVDGQPSAWLRPPFRLPFKLVVGNHDVAVEADGQFSAKLHFRVVGAPG